MRRVARNFDAYTHERYVLADFRARALALTAQGAIQPLDLEHVELGVALHARAPPLFVVFRAKEANIAKTPRARGFCALTGR